MTTTDIDSNHNHPNSTTENIPTKKVPKFDDSDMSSSSSTSTRKSNRRTLKCRRRRPRVFLGTARRDADAASAIALPLGMSFAAVLLQVFEKKDVAIQGMSIDHLSAICTSAIRESLSNVFGDKFDCFTRNFERSFESTLRTLKLIKESSQDRDHYLSHTNFGSSTSNVASHMFHNSRVSISNSASMNCPPVSRKHENIFYGVQDNIMPESMHMDLALNGHSNQLACISRNSLGPATDQSVLSTFEKSVAEQARSNDLKIFKLGLTMRKMKLKEAQLAVDLDSNHIQRSKLDVGKSRASFKAEKFKTELEETRGAELLKQCMDFLVAEMFLMCSFLAYGAYIFSYRRITEATASCQNILRASQSWWIPKPVSSFNSAFQILKCHFQVLSQMLFACFIFFAVVYLLLQRSMTSRQTMPITFIVLLLGVACGFAGKLCVDSMGGSGLLWLTYWWTICLLHFFANVCTTALYRILYGPITVSQGKNRHYFPHWVRRVLFYIVLVLLPLFCGLTPFASLSEWRDHFMQLVMKSWITTGDLN